MHTVIHFFSLSRLTVWNSRTWSPLSRFSLLSFYIVWIDAALTIIQPLTTNKYKTQNLLECFSWLALSLQPFSSSLSQWSWVCLQAHLLLPALPAFLAVLAVAHPLPTSPSQSSQVRDPECACRLTLSLLSAVARPLGSPALLPGAPQPLCTSPLVTRPSALRSLMKLCLYLLLGNGDISSPSKISSSSG